ncbi:MAG: hypothetical protein ACJA0J_000734, partial [Bdellovibrionota bacterium]
TLRSRYLVPKTKVARKKYRNLQQDQEVVSCNG